MLHGFLRSAAVGSALFSILHGQKTQNEGNPSVYAWGLNSSGQLGIGSEISRGEPTLIEELAPYAVKQVFTSGVSRSNAALTTEGKVFTWGNGMDGVLGLHQTDSNQLIPMLVDDLEEHTFVKVSVGQGHMVGLNSEGRLVSWGLNDNGQLGHVKDEEAKTSKHYRPPSLKGGEAPYLVGGELETRRVIDFSCGSRFTAAVTEEGELYTWGMGRDYILGHNDRNKVTAPKKVEALGDLKFWQVACGRNFIIALGEDGFVYAWGNNSVGQLGNSKFSKVEPVPQKIRTLKDVVSIVAGDFHCAAITQDGKVFTWGAGEEGQLGHGNKSNLSTPRLVENIEPVSQVAAGGGHTGVLTTTGKVLMFGRGRDGQLGRAGKVESIASYRTTPLLVEHFGTSRVISLTCGSDHTVALV